MAPNKVDRAGRIVEGARIHIARLQADDERPVDPRQPGLERINLHASLVIGRDADISFAAQARGSRAR